MSKKSELLLDDGELLVVQTKLAIIVGDRQAIALQQIHYWLDLNAKADKESHFFDGFWWAYNTWDEWREKNFPFWSKRTIQRIFDDLSAEALIVVRPHEGNRKGNWVTINYGELQIKLERFNEGLKVRRPVRRITKGGQIDHPRHSVRVDKLSSLPSQTVQPTGNTETNTEKKDSAPDSAGVSKARQVVDALTKQRERDYAAAVRKPRKTDPIFDALTLHIFKMDATTVKEAKAGGRIAKLKKWLGETYPQTTPDDVKAFAAHCGDFIPRDKDKFAERWVEWRTLRTKQPALRLVQKLPPNFEQLIMANGNFTGGIGETVG